MAERLRTCIGCRTTASKRELFRIARTPEGTVFDATGKGPGRGAYVCSLPCFQAARKSGRIASALRCKVDAEACAAIEDGLKKAASVAAQGCEGC